MIQLTCVQCGAAYLRKPYAIAFSKFCSRTCQARATVAGHNRKQWAEIVCSECGKHFLVTPNRKDTAKHCSRLCHNRAVGRFDKRGDLNPTWKGGIQTYRRHKKTTCERCDSTKHLLVHHKDENRYNNKLSNLETLCKRCHQMHHHCEQNLPSLRR